MKLATDPSEGGGAGAAKQGDAGWNGAEPLSSAGHKVESLTLAARKVLALRIKVFRVCVWSSRLGRREKKKKRSRQRASQRSGSGPQWGGEAAARDVAGAQVVSETSSAEKSYEVT